MNAIRRPTWCPGVYRPMCLMVAVLFWSALPAWSQVPAPLPAGTANVLVDGACAPCHGVGRLANARKSREDWEDTVSQMLAYGAPLAKSDVTTVVDYLAANFPGAARPTANLVPGPVRVLIREWETPGGPHPHDPAYAPDGSIWYTGQSGNLIGRFDPRTGQFKQYHLKTPRSPQAPYGAGPHGLVADKEGNIWFTAQQGGYVGKLNPKTGEVVEYRANFPMNGAHTPIFDLKGTFWFTLQQGNMVGRIVPRTGEVKLVTVPTANSNPYGIAVNSKGIPYFTEFRSNKLASIDPETMEIKEYVLPDPGARPRRIAITPDDALWYADHDRGYLGRLDPKTGKVTEWPSPSGLQSRPYGIASVGNVVWYSESGVKPNTIVRFDPQAEKFQSWAIPSGGGVVRKMIAAPDGTLWFAASGYNKIGKVEVVAGSSVTR